LGWASDQRDYQENFTEEMITQWQELLEIARFISFSDEEVSYYGNIILLGFILLVPCMLSLIFEGLPLYTYQVSEN
jgi:hypothetical protein